MTWNKGILCEFANISLGEFLILLSFLVVNLGCPQPPHQPMLRDLENISMETVPPNMSFQSGSFHSIVPPWSAHTAVTQWLIAAVTQWLIATATGAITGSQDALWRGCNNFHSINVWTLLTFLPAMNIWFLSMHIYCPWNHQVSTAWGGKSAKETEPFHYLWPFKKEKHGTEKAANCSARLAQRPAHRELWKCSTSWFELVHTNTCTHILNIRAHIHST